MGRSSKSSSQSIGRSTSFFKYSQQHAVNDENIRVLHRNMLFPVESVTDLVMKTDDKHFALLKANLLMDLYFND